MKRLLVYAVIDHLRDRDLAVGEFDVLFSRAFSRAGRGGAASGHPAARRSTPAGHRGQPEPCPRGFRAWQPGGGSGRIRYRWFDAHSNVFGSLRTLSSVHYTDSLDIAGDDLVRNRRIVQGAPDHIYDDVRRDAEHIPGRHDNTEEQDTRRTSVWSKRLAGVPTGDRARRDHSNPRGNAPGRRIFLHDGRAGGNACRSIRPWLSDHQLPTLACNRCHLRGDSHAWMHWACLGHCIQMDNIRILQALFRGFVMNAWANNGGFAGDPLTGDIRRFSPDGRIQLRVENHVDNAPVGRTGFR